MHNTSSILTSIYQHHEVYQDWMLDHFRLANTHINHMQQVNSTNTTQAYCSPQDYHHSLPLLIDSLMDFLWYLLYKMRFLFYTVWPSETMFPALNQVPRYVAEVSGCGLVLVR